MSTKSKFWILALSYVLFIYATLDVVRTPVSFLRSHGLLRLSLSLMFTMTFLTLLILISRQKPFSPMKICGLIAISACYWFASKWITTPEEQIHFFQYGLVGILFSFALKNHFPSRIFTNFSALALATLAGWIDELIQGYLPSRHYDVHDIILNAISALLGLLVLQLFTETHLKKNI